MSTTIETLELEIQSNSKNAVGGIDALTQSLAKLKKATKGGLGLSAVTSQLNDLNKATNSIQASSITNVSGLAKAVQSLGGIKISTSIAGQITAISTALQGANFDRGREQISRLLPALRSLSTLPRVSLSSYINNINKLQKTLSKLNTIDIDSVTTKISELAVAFKPLGDEMEKVSKGFSSFPDKIQQLLNVTTQVPSTNKKASASFTDLFHVFKTVGNAVQRYGNKIWNAIKASSNYTENVNLFTVAMGNYANEAMAYAETVSKALGIDVSDWIRAQGVFMTMATGFGIVGERANVMSKNLTQLGYDLASFYNMDVDDAMTKLKSGLAGELEPLRAIGYDLSQAKLEATALELGIDKTVSSMTQAEKAQLRYYAIMTQVTVTHGDMARTLKDPANQIRVFKAEISMATREIGNAFIPALNALLPYAIAVTKVIRTLAESIASLVGYTSKDISSSTSEIVANIDGGAKKMQSYMVEFGEVGRLTSVIGSGTAEIATNTDAMTENLEESKEEAKKLKSYMLGFDELNVINPNIDSEDDTSSMFDFALPDYEDTFLSGLVDTKVTGIVDKMKEWLGITEEIDSWGELLETKFGNILVTIAYIGTMLLLWRVGTGIVDFVRNFSTFAAGFKALGIFAVIGAAIAGAAWLVNNTKDTMTKIGAILSGAALAVGAVLAFTGINLPLGIALMAVGAISMGTAIAMNTDKLSDEVKGVIAIITSAVSVALLAIGAILAFTGVNIPLGIALMAGGALIMGTAIIPKWDELSDSVKKTISNIMGIVGGALLVLGAILAFSGVNIPLGIGFMLAGAVSLGTAIALNWDYLVDTLRGPVGLITALISGALLVLGAILLFTGAGIPLGIGLMLAGAAGLGATVAVNWDFLVDKVKGIWEKIKTFWKNHIAPIFTAEWWKTLGKNCINGLIDGFESGINGIISGFEKMINFIVNGLNKISFDIPDWVPEIGGGTFGFNISKVAFGRVTLPRYEDGAFDIPVGQMFIAREAGAEMVGSIGRKTAVANNDQIVAGIAGGVAEANEEQNALLREQNSLLRAILEKDSGVYLDGKNLTNSVEKYQRERGRVLITGGVL